MINSIKDLSEFLHRWYGEVSGNLASRENLPASSHPPALQELWQLTGRLFCGYDEWVRIGKASPFACQDGLATPSGTVIQNGLTHFLFENQGCWSMAYRNDDPSPDPQVISNAIELEFSNAGHVPIGARLSELLITAALMETAFFASSDSTSEDCVDECHNLLWTGAYYNAPGFVGYDGPPSHHFHCNSDQSLLIAEISAGHDPIVASRELARKRWSKLYCAT